MNGWRPPKLVHLRMGATYILIQSCKWTDGEGIVNVEVVERFTTLAFSFKTHYASSNQSLGHNRDFQRWPVTFQTLQMTVLGSARLECQWFKKNKTINMTSPMGKTSHCKCKYTAVELRNISFIVVWLEWNMPCGICNYLRLCYRSEWHHLVSVGDEWLIK